VLIPLTLSDIARPPSETADQDQGAGVPYRVSVQPTRADLDMCLHAAGRRLLAAMGGGPPGSSDRVEPLSDAPPGIGLQVVGAHGSATSSVQGWRVAQDGPYDEVCAQAAFGLLAVHGRAAGRLEPIGVPYVGATAASLALQGALAVVVGRLRGLVVEHAAVSVPAAAALTVSQYLAAATAAEDPEAGQPQQPCGTLRPPFRSADGVLLELESLDAAPWQAFWARLGADPQAAGHSWRPFVLRYPKATCGLYPQLHQALAEWTYAELVHIAAETGMSLCPVRSVAQRRSDPDVLAAAGAPTPWRLTTYPAATSASHEAAARSELPLAGLRVIESCRRVQGPLAGRLLVLLGAEVMRIEPPGGDPLRGMPPMAGDCSARFVALNHGKQVVEVDIRTPAGQAQVGALVRDADVFLHNWAPGKAECYRLDAEHLQRIRPELVYAQASAWGGIWGSADPPLGTDFMVQAHSGLAEVLGEPGSPRPSLMTLLDLLGAHVCIEGVLAGLAQRYLDGRGRRVESSLLGAADVLLTDRLHPDAGRARLSTGCGAAPRPIIGVFDTADEPLALGARSATGIDALCRAVGIPAPTHPRETTRLRAQLEPMLRTRPARCWLDRLHTTGIPAAVVRRDLTALPADSRLAGHTTHHGCTVLTSPWRFS
jgi:crotonobetainyl-CoA:carnitine CoA-transferase CaiB-like acyl-CoA transferase